MLSNLLISLVVIVVSTILGCSTSAPALPTDYGSAHSVNTIDKSIFNHSDLKKSCDSIYAENRELKQYRSNIDKEVEASRVGNQAAVYLFGVATMLLGTNGNIEDQLNKIQSRLDTLRLLAKYKKCDSYHM